MNGPRLKAEIWVTTLCTKIALKNWLTKFGHGQFRPQWWGEFQSHVIFFLNLKGSERLTVQKGCANVWGSEDGHQ